MSQKRYLYIVLLLPIVFGWNACSPMHTPPIIEVTGESVEGGSGGGNNGGGSTQDIVTTGRMLYSAQCASCHGSIDPQAAKPSNIYNRSVGQINSAIENVPAMSALSILSPQDVFALASALVYVQAPSENTEDIADATVQLGTRHYVASVLETIFVATTSPTADDTTIKTIITNLVRNQISAFGGPCYRYDYNCPGGEAGGRPAVATNHYAKARPSSNSMRMGYKVRSCQEVLQVDKAVVNALAKVNLTVNSPNNSTNMVAIYNLFSPDQSYTDAVINSLSDTYATAISKGLSVTNAWRFTLLPLCQSALTERL